MSRFWAQPRQPCVGLLIGAVAGILIAEHWTVNLRPLAIGVVAVSLGWVRWKKPALFWLSIVGSFAMLHGLAIRENPGRRLAEKLGAERQVVRGTGIVIDEPKETETFYGRLPHYRFTLQLETISTGDAVFRSDAKVHCVWVGAPPLFGDRVSFTGDVRELPVARNPGQFDYTAYLHRLGIFSAIHLHYPNDGAVLSHGHGSRLVMLAQRSRRWMQNKLTLGLDDSPEIAGLAQSLVLGLKEETPEQTRELFQRTGTLHLFVVNGLHVGMFAAIAAFILKPLRVRRRGFALVLIPLLVFYALLTGLNPGSIRATIMAAVVLGAWFAERTPLSFNSLAAAAFAMLLWDTNELFMPGFQFSFGVVFMIILLAGSIHRALLPLGSPDPFLPRTLWNKVQAARAAAWHYVSGLMAVSTAASLGSSPFTAKYFHLLAPSALVANLLVVPLALVILFEGVLAMLAGMAADAISGLFNNVTWLVAHGVLGLVHFFAQLPGGHVFIEFPRKHAPCEITVFDLGAGGAAHVRCGNQGWLVDCGNDAAYENIVREFLRTRGVNRLDGLMLTHGDVAHVGAAALVLADFQPRDVVDSALRDRSANRRAFHALLLDKQLGKSICERGDMFWLGRDICVRVLYPPAGIAARTADDKALVLQFESCGVRVLMMSDAGFFTERWLLDHEPDLRSDILIKGRHASELSGTPDFLAAVQPRAVICSAAEFPTSEQVNEDWARDVTARGMALFRQDKTGAVEITISPEQWRVCAFLGNQIFMSRTR